MYLKSLYLQGFKSFPDRTEIRFSSGLTAIVGPNGSGKSNISDAIRWVLGEQSTKSLRGARMEDIIFAGTKKRNAVGFAEVSLILDNSDGLFPCEYSEIMVTRRFYRSGESEYTINKKKVRLRDIYELFMDTGLGRDGYSVIGQGRIDEILSVKSEDRRQVFEEAAGISKFRCRKEEAEHRLEGTRENLIRIGDLWTELSLQKDSLKIQAEKTKIYCKLRDALKEQEVSLWMQTLKVIDEKQEGYKKSFQGIEGQLKQAEEERAQVYDRQDRLTEYLQQQDVSLEQLRNELSFRERQEAEWKSQEAVLQTNLRNGRENIRRTQEERMRKLSQQQEMEEQIRNRRNGLCILEEDLKKLDDEVQAQNAKRIAMQIEAGRENEIYKALLLRLREEEQAHTVREAECLRLDMTDQAIRDRQEVLSHTLESLRKQISEEEEKNQVFQGQKKLIAEEMKRIDERSLLAEKEEKNYEKYIRQMAEKRQEAQSALTECRGLIRMLEQMERDYEGFSRSVKTVMQWSDNGRLTGICGPVSSLITVAPQNITAVETALGGGSSNLVTRDQKAAQRAIEMLKNSKGGRATFLPLDQIRGSRILGNLTREAGFIGVASDLVDCWPEYRNMIEHLLGHTVVTENLQQAAVMSSKHHAKFRIVTRDGQIISTGGAMTGGSVSHTSGVLSRAERLNREKNRGKKVQDRLIKWEKALQRAEEEKKSKQSEWQKIQSEQKRLISEEARLQAILSQHDIFLGSLRRQISDGEAEMDSLNEESKKKRISLEEFRQAQKEASIQKETVEAQIELQEEKVHQSAEKAEFLQGLGNEKRLELSRKQIQKTEGEQSLKALLSLQAEREEESDQLERQVHFYEKENEKLICHIHELNSRKETDERLCFNLQEKIRDTTKKRLEMESRRVRAEKEIQQQNDNILKLEREKASLDGKISQLKMEARHILDKMWESYELTPSHAKSIAISIGKKMEAEQKVNSLKKQIFTLGQIRPDAVEEFAKLSERLSFLTDQKDDLEKAQEELYQVIAQMTQEMKQIFAKQFEVLNRNFGETFREIFGGGEAEIYLSDRSDILNCGIEIRVTPPGKTVKSMTLLSGGERAFAAIALYFAILKIRPAPFCVLDEIEAALDDVNVIRFASYIRKLTDKTQFIVITHRRGTMEQADILYGVTMQDSGISKLLMLNLAEAERKLKNTDKVKE